MPFDPPLYRRGDVPSAAQFNTRNAELARLGRTRGAGVNVRQGPGGPQFSRRREPCIYARLTGGPDGGGYPWVEVWPGPLGTWVVTDREGTAANGDLAREMTGQGDLAAGDTVYELCRGGTSGEWLFDSDCCDAGDAPTSCLDCVVPATDLVLTIYSGGVTPATLTLHYRNNDIDLLDGRSAHAPYWYTDCVFAPGNTIRYFFACPIDGAGAMLISVGFYYGEPTFETVCEEVIIFNDGVPDTLASGFAHFSISNQCVVRCVPFYIANVNGEFVPSPFEGNDFVPFGSPLYVVSDGEPSPPPLSIPLCVEVRTPRCGGVAGDLLEGAEVTIAPDGEETPILTETTGPGGRVCTTIEGPAAFTVLATIDGCSHEQTVVITPCGDAVAVVVELTPCCAVVPIRVLDGEDAAIVGGTVTILGDESETDGAGEIEVSLNTLQMLGLAEGDDCTRLLSVTVALGGEIGTAILTYCPTLAVNCGDDEADVHIIHVARVPPNTIPLACCPGADDCTVAGPEGRGLGYRSVYVTYSATVTRGLDTWSYYFEGELVLLLDGLGDPLDGLIVYESDCHTEGGFVSPDPDECGSEGTETEPYLSADMSIEVCREEMPGHMTFRSYHYTPCNTEEIDFLEYPSCEHQIMVDRDIPEGAASLCFGQTILEEWDTSIEGGGTISHSLAVTGISE